MAHEHMHNEHGTPSFPLGLKKFLPLIVIFAAILAFVGAMVWRQGAWDMMYAMRMFMGGFFIVFGAFKVINLKGFVDAYAIYDLIAVRIKNYGYLYPFIELGLGVAYLGNVAPLAVNWVTLVVMLISAAGVANELFIKKNVIPCACLGAVFKIPMTKVTLFEDLLMAVMAAWMLTLL